MHKIQKLLVGIDFSPRSLAAAQIAVAIAQPTGASIELVHVVETKISDSDALILGMSTSELENMYINEAGKALSNFSVNFNYRKLNQTILTGSPAIELTKLYEDRKADLLVVGDTGSGSSTPLKGVGSTAYRLVELGPRNILVVNASHSGKVKKVAAAISFVPVADDVLRRAYHLAHISNAELHILRAIPDIAELRSHLAILPNDIERRLSNSINNNTQRLKEFVDNYKIHDVYLKTVILQGKPGPVLVEYLHKEDIDVVVMGTGTSYRIAGYPIGSNTHRVLNQTLSSVYVVRSLEPAP